MQRATSSRPVRWYTLLGLVTVPVVIAAAFLAGATPTNDDLSRIQGAIVNNDEPAVVDGKEMPLGRMLAAELFDSEREQNYTWVMADEAHATEGLRSGTYAVVVTIPEAFSTDATSYSANDSSARGARIEVATSPAAGISDTALGEMVARTAVGAFNQTITEKYLDNIYLALNSSGEQMASLHEGINKLADGSAGLSDGLGRMSANGGTLAAGADKLATGTGNSPTGSTPWPPTASNSPPEPADCQPAQPSSPVAWPPWPNRPLRSRPRRTPWPPASASTSRAPSN